LESSRSQGVATQRYRDTAPPSPLHHGLVLPARVWATVEAARSIRGARTTLACAKALLRRMAMVGASRDDDQFDAPDDRV
jgi:hypothetical protein